MTATQPFDVATTFGVQARPGLEVLGFADDTHPQIPVRKPYVFRSELLRDVLAYLHDSGGDGMFLSGHTGSGQDEPRHPGRQPAQLAGPVRDLPRADGAERPGRPVRPHQRQHPVRPRASRCRRPRWAPADPQRVRPDGPLRAGGAQRHHRGPAAGDRRERGRGDQAAPEVPGLRHRQQRRFGRRLGTLPRSPATEPGLHGPVPCRSTWAIRSPSWRSR